MELFAEFGRFFPASMDRAMGHGSLIKLSSHAFDLNRFVGDSEHIFS